jgi:hypothetical protein
MLQVSTVLGEMSTVDWDNEKLIEDLNEWAASPTGEHTPPGPLIIGPRPWETKEDEQK